MHTGYTEDILLNSNMEHLLQHHAFHKLLFPVEMYHQ